MKLVADAEATAARAFVPPERFPPPAAFSRSAHVPDEASLEHIRAEAARDPVGYWADRASQLVWSKPWDTALDSSNPPFYKWFVGGETNICYNALDRHV